MERKPCPRCRTTVLTGLSNGSRGASLEITVDRQPLTPATELTAIMAGHRTWTLHTAGELHARTPETITTRVAGSTPRQTVHADHACPAH